MKLPQQYLKPLSHPQNVKYYLNDPLLSQLESILRKNGTTFFAIYFKPTKFNCYLTLFSIFVDKNLFSQVPKTYFSNFCHIGLLFYVQINGKPLLQLIKRTYFFLCNSLTTINSVKRNLVNTKIFTDSSSDPR